MQFAVRAFQLAKDPEHPGQNWATLLSEAVVHGPPDPADREAFAAWLKTQREAWAASIDTSGLAWFQKAKLPLGAFSTLLWVEVSPLPKEQQQPGLFGALRLRSYAIGDSCLFHVRHGELLRCFPLESAEQFQADPLVLGSVDLKRDGLISFSRLEEYCFPDDLVVLCTDAIAEWAVRRQQSGDPPEWMRYWYMSREQWQAEIDHLRAGGQMRYDDATLVLLHIGGEPTGPPPQIETPRRTLHQPTSAAGEPVQAISAAGAGQSGAPEGSTTASQTRRGSAAEKTPPGRQEAQPAGPSSQSSAEHSGPQEAAAELFDTLKREAAELGQEVERGLTDVARKLRKAGRKGWRELRRWLVADEDETPPPPPASGTDDTPRDP